jgi:release factor glutamine methyltransferase
MTLREAKQQLLLCLYDYYSDSEASIIVEMALEELTQLPRIERITNKQLPLSIGQVDDLKRMIQQLADRRPIQYIIGKAWFYGLPFKVSEAVLIPRPETEELVDWIVKDKQSVDELKIIDIGTGSGCIAISIKNKLPQADVTAVDTSANALAVAHENATANQTPIAFVQMDFLVEAEWSKLDQYDVIVSNPPYVKQSEASSMLPHVLAYEPHLALFVADDDALIFYKALASFCQKHLRKNGSLYVEINEALANEVMSLFYAYGFATVEIRNDAQGKARMVKAC